MPADDGRKKPLGPLTVFEKENLRNMENELTTIPEPLSPEEARAKAAILGECENLDAGVTFVAVHFDGYGDSGVTEEVECFDPDYYAYEEHKPVTHDAAYLGQINAQSRCPLNLPDLIYGQLLDCRLPGHWDIADHQKNK